MTTSLPWFYLILVHLVLSYGQTITPLTLCDNYTATVLPKSSGVIQHVQNTDRENCTLTVSGFNQTTLVLPGLGLPPPAGCNDQPMVTVNSTLYCINGEVQPNNTVIHLLMPELVVSVKANELNFTFEYYSNGEKCIVELYVINVCLIDSYGLRTEAYLLIGVAFRAPCKGVLRVLEMITLRLLRGKVNQA